MQAEVGDVTEGPLAKPVTHAGTETSKVQRELTKQRESR